MTADFLVRYVGTAALGAAMLALGAVGAMRLLQGRWQPRLLPLLGFLLFFVLLGLHPFPTPRTLYCPVPYTEPQLTPFDILRRLQVNFGGTHSLRRTLFDLDTIAAAMNLLVCLPIGLALAPFGVRPAAGLAIGVLLSLAVETAQLTGLFGVYPCAYRQFDVDDLILNSLGVWLGVVIASRIGGHATGP